MVLLFVLRWECNIMSIIILTRELENIRKMKRVKYGSFNSIASQYMSQILAFIHSDLNHRENITHMLHFIDYDLISQRFKEEGRIFCCVRPYCDVFEITYLYSGYGWRQILFFPDCLGPVTTMTRKYMISSSIIDDSNLGVYSLIFKLILSATSYYIKYYVNLRRIQIYSVLLSDLRF